MNLISGMEAFIQVADTKSFVIAARNLGLTPSATSKLIARTEEYLSSRLFNRSTRSLSLTPEGMMFLTRCRSILDELEVAKRELTNAASLPAGILRVSLPNVSSLFLPKISDFMEMYPEVTLEIDFTDRLVDVIEEGFDVVIRTGMLNDSRLTARFLARYEMRLVASPAYLLRKGEPASPEELAVHDCIQYRFPSTGRTEVWPLKDYHEQKQKFRNVIICNNTEARLNLALKGKGIACLPDYLVKDKVENGELEELLSDWLIWEGEFNILWPSGRQASPKIRVFIDYISQVMFK